MKNMNFYIATAIVSLIMVVDSAFLINAPDEPNRQAGMNLHLFFGAIGTWAATKAGLLELDYEEHRMKHSAHHAV